MHVKFVFQTFQIYHIAGGKEGIEELFFKGKQFVAGFFEFVKSDFIFSKKAALFFHFQAQVALIGQVRDEAKHVALIHAVVHEAAHDCRRYAFRRKVFHHDGFLAVARPAKRRPGCREEKERNEQQAVLQAESCPIVHFFKGMARQFHGDGHGLACRKLPVGLARYVIGRNVHYGILALSAVVSRIVLHIVFGKADAAGQFNAERKFSGDDGPGNTQQIPIKLGVFFKKIERIEHPVADAIGLAAFHPDVFVTDFENEISVFFGGGKLESVHLNVADDAGHHFAVDLATERNLAKNTVARSGKFHLNDLFEIGVTLGAEFHIDIVVDDVEELCLGRQNEQTQGRYEQAVAQSHRHQNWTLTFLVSSCATSK